MVLPLFGWSAGDVISGARALYRIGQAFSETQGAERQYAEASKVLEILANDRNRAQDLIDSHPTSTYTADIKAKLAIVETAYKVFERHQNDYKDLEPVLTATASKRRDVLKKQTKKFKWAVEQMNGNLETLKQAIVGPLASINASMLHMALGVKVHEAVLDAYER